MNRSELLEELTQDILAYAMHGSFPERELAKSIKPEQLDDRFEEYELLLDLHFILKEDVVSFVRELPKQLRSIRTETRTRSRIRRGTVDGRINWQETIEKRYSNYPRDRSLFVCDNRSEDYDIPENVVLKRLVSVIHTTIQEAEEYLRGEYEWVSETWKDNENLIDDLQRIVERNVHVRRIRDPEAYEPTERMLTTAANSRHDLYRTAASLLRSRQALFRGEPDAIRTLLEETAIAPDDVDSLFELFVLFRFVATLEDRRETQPQFKTIATDRQEVARFEGDKEIVLYHDNSARDRDLSFLAVPEEDKDELSRTEKVQLTAQETASDYFGREFRNHTGRPDIIVLEVISEDGDHEYLITEVKNSTNSDTIRKGIKETLEYLAFLRVNEEFVFDHESDPDAQNCFGSGWNGLLVVQDLESDTASLGEQSDKPITILQASELERDLDVVLHEIV